MEQLTQELVTRARAVVASEKKDYTEMGKVHGAITGTHYACTPCNEQRILYTLNSFINHPERYAGRIKQAATEMEEQKQPTNYRFSKNATSKLIVLVTAHGVVKVTPENLTDERAKAVLAHKLYAHNIERIPGTEPEEEEEDTDPDGDADPKGEGDSDPVSDPEGEGDTDPATETGGAGTEPEEEGKELTLAEAKVRFEQVTGQKPGSRNLATLLKAIKKAEEESK